MAKQAKRSHLAPLATRWLPTNASDAMMDSTASQPEASPGRADFLNAPLSPADFAAADLSHALFSHADLAGANFAKANLARATLRFAAVSFADLEAADISGADLRLACLDKAKLSAANLSGALLDHASLAGANLAEATLRGASLRFATLEAATLLTADLSCADLRYARLDRVDLSGADLSGALLDYADFSGANLASTNLSGACLRYAKNLTQAQLAQARVSESTTLPLYLHESTGAPWARGQSHKTNSRQIWIVGPLIAAFASLSLAWHFLDPRNAVEAQVIVAPGHGAALPKVASLSPTVAAPDLRVVASEASRHIAATPAYYAPLHPANRSPDPIAEPSDALSVAAGMPPAAIVNSSIKVLPYKLVLSRAVPPW